MTLRHALRTGPFDAALVAELNALARLVFAGDEIDVGWRLARMPDASAALTYAGDALVGFKLGYAMTETKYYSWIGGVHPERRREGIAGALMAYQHDWVRERGYAAVETATDQENAGMLQVNLRHGFTVCGLRSEPTRVQLLLRKELGG